MSKFMSAYRKANADLDRDGLLPVDGNVWRGVAWAVTIEAAVALLVCWLLFW